MGIYIYICDYVYYIHIDIRVYVVLIIGLLGFI